MPLVLSKPSITPLPFTTRCFFSCMPANDKGQFECKGIINLAHSALPDCAATGSPEALFRSQDHPFNQPHGGDPSDGIARGVDSGAGPVGADRSQGPQ
jgi:hypothetical protein